MINRRLRLTLWGSATVALFLLAMISSSALAGAGNEQGHRILGIAIAAGAFLLCGACGLRIAVDVVSGAKIAFAVQLRKQKREFDASLAQRDKELIRRIEQAQIRSQNLLELILADAHLGKVSNPEVRSRENELIDEVVAVARSQGLKDEQIAIMRNQVQEHLETLRISELNTAMSAKGARAGVNDTAQGPAEAQSLHSRIASIESGQRRILNSLKKDSNMHLVLERLQASERRLLSSFGAGALTLASELSSSRCAGEPSKRGDV